MLDHIFISLQFCISLNMFKMFLNYTNTILFDIITTITTTNTINTTTNNNKLYI